MRLLFFFVRGPLLPGYLRAIDVDVREKKRESVDIENFNYRQQIGGKFGLEKACPDRKKVDRSNVDIRGVHCSRINSHHSQGKKRQCKDNGGGGGGNVEILKRMQLCCIYYLHSCFFLNPSPLITSLIFLNSFLNS